MRLGDRSGMIELGDRIDYSSRTSLVASDSAVDAKWVRWVDGT